MIKIPFNKPFFIGNEIEYIKQSIQYGKISGDGIFTEKCHQFFEKKFRFKKVLLTTSCTDALEMTAILMDIKPGDEVIVPSFTFVSTANAFVLRGAKIVFADSHSDLPNVSDEMIEELITENTKAIVVVHYAGVACNMDKILRIANKHNLYVIEDAAQAIDSKYKEEYLGSLGHLATFSFHETKNIISGEGGMLVVNDDMFTTRAEIIREKGTNRSAFFRGEIDKYGWVDIGSSFLPSDLIAAFLYAQLEHIDQIQKKRLQIWERYNNSLRLLEQQSKIRLPYIPEYATNNGHLFYILCNSEQERDDLIDHLKNHHILAVFHYLPLHKSDFYKGRHDGRILKNAEYFSERIVRLPFYFELTENDQDYIIDQISNFFLK